jgi:hypothetical protein
MAVLTGCVGEWALHPAPAWSAFPNPFARIPAAELPALAVHHGRDAKSQGMWDRALGQASMGAALTQRAAAYLTLHVLRLGREHAAVCTLHRTMCAVEPNLEAHPAYLHHDALRSLLALGRVPEALGLTRHLGARGQLSPVAHGLMLQGLHDQGLHEVMLSYVREHDVELSGFRGFLVLRAALALAPAASTTPALAWVIQRLLQPGATAPATQTANLLLRHYITATCHPTEDVLALVTSVLARRIPFPTGGEAAPLLHIIASLFHIHRGPLPALLPALRAASHRAPACTPAQRAAWDLDVCRALLHTHFPAAAVAYWLAGPRDATTRAQYDTLLCRLLDVGRLTLVARVTQGLAQAGTPLDLTTHSILCCGFLRRGRAREALAWFAGMLRVKTSPPQLLQEGQGAGLVERVRACLEEAEAYDRRRGRRVQAAAPMRRLLAETLPALRHL